MRLWPFLAALRRNLSDRLWSRTPVFLYLLGWLPTAYPRDLCHVYGAVGNGGNGR